MDDLKRSVFPAPSPLRAKHGLNGPSGGRCFDLKKNRCRNPVSASPLPPSLFSPVRNSNILDTNAMRRATSARKMKQLREKIAGARSSVKKKPNTAVPNRLRFGGIPLKFDLGPSSLGPVTVSTPQQKSKARKERQEATPLTSALKKAFEKAEENFPAELKERNITLAKDSAQSVSETNEDTNAIDENATPRNLADAFECSSPAKARASLEILQETDFNLSDVTNSEKDTDDTDRKHLDKSKKNSKKPEGTPLSSRMMSRLDLVVSNVHAGQQYGRVATRHGRTPVRRSLRIRKLEKQSK